MNMRPVKASVLATVKVAVTVWFDPHVRLLAVLLPANALPSDLMTRAIPTLVVAAFACTSVKTLDAGSPVTLLSVWPFVKITDCPFILKFIVVPADPVVWLYATVIRNTLPTATVFAGSVYVYITTSAPVPAMEPVPSCTFSSVTVLPLLAPTREALVIAAALSVPEASPWVPLPTATVAEAVREKPESAALDGLPEVHPATPKLENVMLRPVESKLTAPVLEVPAPTKKFWLL